MVHGDHAVAAVVVVAAASGLRYLAGQIAVAVGEEADVLTIAQAGDVAFATVAAE